MQSLMIKMVTWLYGAIYKLNLKIKIWNMIWKSKGENQLKTYRSFDLKVTWLIFYDRFFAGRRRYLINFHQLIQFNEETGNRRPIMALYTEPSAETPATTSTSKYKGNH